MRRARRLGLTPPTRSAHLLDALELFAFVRPARFCAPSAAGLALAQGYTEPEGAEAQAAALRQACQVRLDELVEHPTPTREEALQVAETLGRAGWSWAARVAGALRSRAMMARRSRGSGLDVWSRRSEWEGP